MHAFRWFRAVFPIFQNTLFRNQCSYLIIVLSMSNYVNTIMEVDNYSELSRNNPAEKSGLQNTSVATSSRRSRSTVAEVWMAITLTKVVLNSGFCIFDRRLSVSSLCGSAYRIIWLKIVGMHIINRIQWTQTYPMANIWFDWHMVKINLILTNCTLSGNIALVFRTECSELSEKVDYPNGILKNAEISLMNLRIK